MTPDTVENNYATPGGEFWKKGFEDKNLSPLTTALVRQFVNIYLKLALCSEKLISKIRRTSVLSADFKNISVLAIGPFYSANWTAAQLEPLVHAGRVTTVRVITPIAFADTAGIVYHCPPAWLRRVCGMPIARSLCAIFIMMRYKPQLVIGYHLPWNGIVALIVGKLGAAKVVYFSVGGPAEIDGGGIYSEHALFSRQGRENPRAENMLLSIIGRFDAMLTMGSQAKAYFEAHGIKVPVCAVSVGVNPDKFARKTGSGPKERREFDMITVSRLARIKRVDLFLRIVAEMRDDLPAVTAIVVGDGPETTALKQLTSELEIDDNVIFAGWTDAVSPLLHQSKVFVMTSASEGLPLSLIEAMQSGIPAVVPDIGDISDLVQHGSNGYLVTGGDASEFRRSICRLLEDSSAYDRMAQNSTKHALKYSVPQCTIRWESFLNAISVH